MANLRETSTWEAGIYQLETSDPVMGGENGIDNRAPRQLANRTLWLKNELARQIGEINQSIANANNAKADKAVQFTAGNGLTGGGDLSASRTLALGTPSKITATSINTAISNTHSHEIDKASTTTQGIVQLNDTLTSTATNQALTANQGKVLNDRKLGNQGHQILAGRLNITNNEWAKLHFPLSDGSQWFIEANPNYKSAQNGGLGIRFLQDDNGTRRFYDLVKSDQDETIAYQSWTNAELIKKANSQHRHSWSAIDGKPSTFTPSNHNHAWGDITGVPSASTNTIGIVRLNNTLSSTSQSEALTALQGKTLQDGKLDKAGGVLTGTLYVPNSGVKGANDNDTGIEFPQDGILNIKVDNKNRILINFDAVNLYSVHGHRLALQNDKNLVFYDTNNSVIWATNSMLQDIAGKTNKTGDTMTGHLRLDYGNEWVGMSINNKTPNKHIFYDACVGGICKGGMQVVSLGNGKYDTKLLVTPAGNDTQDRRVAGLTVYAEGLHSHAYGHLHEYFVKTRDNQTIDGNKTFSQEVVTTQDNGFRIKNFYRNRSVFFRYDGDVFYLLKTPDGDPNGKWDDTRPFLWDTRNNNVILNGNVATATKLQTARNISLTGAVTGSVNFDGSGNVSLATTLTKATVRYFNRTISGWAIAFDDETNNIEMTGQVVVSADGLIRQYFHLKHFRDLWFGRDDNAVGYQNHNIANYRIPIALWTAMPNKILSVQAQTMRSSNTTSSAQFSSEADRTRSGLGISQSRYR